MRRRPLIALAFLPEGAATTALGAGVIGFALLPVRKRREVSDGD